MSTSISIGFSQHHDGPTAVLQACVQAKNTLGTTDTDLVMVFATPGYIGPETLAVIGRTLKPKRLVGSSAAGLHLPKAVAGQGITVVCINSDDMRFGVSAAPAGDHQDPRTAGFELARKATLDLDLPRREAFITFGEGMEASASAFIRGLRENLGGGFPLLGGISGDELNLRHCRQFFQDQLLEKSGVGLLIGGAVRMSLGCKHGFKPLGKPRRITKAEGNIIRSIDGQPAFEIYQHFLGPEADGLKSKRFSAYSAMYPLGIYEEGSSHYLLRNVIDILEDGSILCHEVTWEGAEVHLMISNPAACNHSAIEAAKEAKASLGERTPSFVLVLESWARLKIMRQGAFSVVQNIKDVLGPWPVVGMYSYGEIGPFGNLNNIKNVFLHNSSILVAAIA